MEKTRVGAFALVFCLTFPPGTPVVWAAPQADQHPEQQRAPQKRPAQNQHAKPAASGHAPARPASRPSPAHPANRPATRPAQTARPARQPAARPSPAHPANRPTTRPARRAPASARRYQFRSQDISRLRNQYRGNYAHINRARRPHFYRGGYIPVTYRHYFQPVPPALITYLPPVPPGYAIGYYDGYVVVYSLAAFAILSVIDLMAQ